MTLTKELFGNMESPRTTTVGLVAASFLERGLDLKRIQEYIRFANVSLRADRIGDEKASQLPGGHNFLETFFAIYPVGNKLLGRSYETYLDEWMTEQGLDGVRPEFNWFMANACIGHVWSKGDISSIPTAYREAYLRTTINGREWGIPVDNSVRSVESLEPDELFTTLRVLEGKWYAEGCLGILTGKEVFKNGDVSVRRYAHAIEAMQIVSDMRHTKNPKEPSFKTVVEHLQVRDKEHTALKEAVHVGKAYGVSTLESSAMWFLTSMLSSRHTHAEWDRVTK